MDMPRLPVSPGFSGYVAVSRNNLLDAIRSKSRHGASNTQFSSTTPSPSQRSKKLMASGMRPR